MGAAASVFTLMVAVVTLVATIWLYIIVPKGLLPQQDTGLILGFTDAAQSISFKTWCASKQRVLRKSSRRIRMWPASRRSSARAR